VCGSYAPKPACDWPRIAASLAGVRYPEDFGTSASEMAKRGRQPCVQGDWCACKALLLHRLVARGDGTSTPSGAAAPSGAGGATAENNETPAAAPTTPEEAERKNRELKQQLTLRSSLNGLTAKHPPPLRKTTNMDF
jgi:hypothetical protein